MTGPGTPRRRALGAAFVFFLVVAGAAAVVPGLRVDTDITRFLPPSGDPRIDRVLRTVAGSELNRMVILTLRAAPEPADGGDPAPARPTADEDPGAAPPVHRGVDALTEALRGQPDVAWLRAGPDQDLERAVYELYHPHRLGFVRDDPPDAGPILSPAELAARAQDLRRRLALPTSPLLRELAPGDPWLLFPRRLEALRDQLAGGLEVAQGHFVDPDDPGTAVVFLASRSSPFDVPASRRFLRGIRAAVDHAEAAVDVSLDVAQSGVHRFAVRGERRTRDDIRRVSLVGTVSVLLFLFGLFRSLRLLLVAQGPLVFGVAVAFLVAGLVLDRVHGLTIAFAATLIGVTLDYVVHALNHLVLRPGPPEASPFRRVRVGIALGGATTIAGLAGLGWTGFPAIQEMALLTSAGVAGALVGTLVLLPQWVPRDPIRASAPHRALARGAATVLRATRRHRGLAAAGALAVAGALAAGLSQAAFVDDVRALDPPDADLLAEDDRVRTLVGRVDVGRLVVVTAPDAESALRVNDAVAQVLDGAVADGLLRRFRSLHALVWAPDLQRRNLAAVAPADATWEATARAYAAAGFRPEAFAPFRAALRAPPPPLALEEVLASPLGPLAAPFVLDPPGGGAPGVTLGTYLVGVDDPRGLADRIAGVAGATWLDQPAALARGYRRFRTRTLELVAAGLVAVFLLLLVRYRRLGTAAAAFAPSVLAGTAALGALAWLGDPLTLFHVVSLILVLSMGVDYGVFLAEAAVQGDDAGEEAAVTLVSLVVAALSTCLSFGALALSGQPALEAIGRTTAIGVALSLGLAPVAFLFVAPRSNGRTPPAGGESAAVSGEPPPPGRGPR